MFSFFKIISKKQFTAEVLWVGFGVFFSTVGTFVGVRLLTSVMTPLEYGKLALGISISMGFVYSIGVAFWGTITRFYSVAKEDGSADWYWQSIRKSLYSLSLFFIFCGAASTICLNLLNFKHSEILFWVFAIAFGGVQVIGETGSALQNGARNRKIFGLHQNLLGWGRFLIAYLFLVLWEPMAQKAMLGFVVAGAITMVSQRYWVKKKIISKWPKTGLKKDRRDDFFNYFKPLAISGVFIWIQLFADRWAIEAFASMEDVGIYFALYQISYSPALYLSSFLLHLLGPVLYHRAGDGTDQNRIDKTTGLNGLIAGQILLFILVGTFVAFLIGEKLCFLLIDSNFSKGFWAFPWLFATSGIYSVGQQLLMSFYSGVDMGVIIPFRVITTVLAIGCYMIGGMQYGFAGIIGGGFIFSIVYLVLSFFMHSKVRKISITTK